MFQQLVLVRSGAAGRSLWHQSAEKKVSHQASVPTGAPGSGLRSGWERPASPARRLITAGPSLAWMGTFSRFPEF